MEEQQNFFTCKKCKNLTEMIKDSGERMVCCGEPMTKLIPNTAEGSAEKHVPAVTVSDRTVSVEVGSIPHPMLEEHHIEWIYLQTEKGRQRRFLRLDETASAVFELVDDRPIAAFEYCNIHGLWKSDINDF